MCASPPAGTDSRFRKCIFPRRTAAEKGPRDEVDVIAVKDNWLMLLEAKPRLSDSLSILNARGESDDVKLRRLRDSRTPEELCLLLRQGFGTVTTGPMTILIALAVGVCDCPAPSDLIVYLVESDGVTEFGI